MNVLFFLARCGTQIIVPYRCMEDYLRHLKPMGDIGQIMFNVSFKFFQILFLFQMGCTFSLKFQEICSEKLVVIQKAIDLKEFGCF